MGDQDYSWDRPGESHPSPGAPRPAPPPGAPLEWQQSPPPPGYPPAPPPGHPQGPPPGYVTQAQQLAAAHKPGSIPLRPLGLGDLYDGAIKTIRQNPQATVGSSVVVSAVAMLIPVIVSGILTFTVGASTSALEDPYTSGEASQMVGVIGSYAALVIGTILQMLGAILVTGMNAVVAVRAAVGHRVSLAEAWAGTRGNRWRLLGMMLLMSVILALYLAVVVLVCVGLAFALPILAAVLVILVISVVALVGMLFFWVRVYYFAVPPLILENSGVFGALGRSWSLSAGRFWPIFGIALLTYLLAQVVGSILATPLSLAATVLMAADPGGAGLFLYNVFLALGVVVTSALVTPFITTVTSLQYVDQRIRKEAFDVELMRRAGLLDS